MRYINVLNNIPTPSFLELVGTGMLYKQSETDPLQFNTVDAFNNYVNHTLVLLVFVGFPGLRGGLGCCPMVLCIQVTHELYLLIVGLFV